MDIAVVYSLPTHNNKNRYKATDEDTESTAQEVLEALQVQGYTAFLVPISEHTIADISAIRADMIFNLIEWTNDDLAYAQDALTRIERLGIPFTGSSQECYMLICEKIRMKQAFDDQGIPSPRWQMFETGTEEVRPDFHYPVIIKLAREHCSIGLDHQSVVGDATLLKSEVVKRLPLFHQPLIAEEFIGGREFQVTLYERGDTLIVLPPAEITYIDTALPFLTYESRWDETHPDYRKSGVKLAALSDTLKQEIEAICRHAFTTLSFADYARMDMRMDDNAVYILEANCNPGLGDSDEYGMTLSYKAAGMTFADFVGEIVLSCQRRFRMSAKK